MEEKIVLDGLEINPSVAEKMVSIAAMEVEGVASMCKKAVDFSGIISGSAAFKPVKVSVVNGAVNLDVYICAKPGFNVKTVAQAVQQNVKDKLQDMTGNAVTRVNVHIADLAEEK